jgi:hypothetical protein
MLQLIEERANLSVARGCGALAIGTFMIGLSSEIVMAFQAGGFLSLLACMVLLLKAYGASRRPYKTTELWVMLKATERPEAAIAQRIIGTVLRDVYLRFAQHAAWIGLGMLVMAVVLARIPVRPA